MKRLYLALVAALVLAAFRPWGQEEAGNRAYRRGDYRQAVERYREAVAKGGGTPRLQYNLGTALLRQGELAAARERLSDALAAQSAELRARTFYNLGNALALEPAGSKEENLRAAIESYRRSLLLDDSRADARWNLELAMRQLAELERARSGLPGGAEEQPPEESPAGAGEGRGSGRESGEGPQAPQPGAAGQSRAAGRETVDAPFPRELAEQILRAVEERERAIQREKLKRQGTTAKGPDW